MDVACGNDQDDGAGSRGGGRGVSQAEVGAAADGRGEFVQRRSFRVGRDRQLQYDTFGGAWGDVKQLDRFLQAYAVEKTRIEARRQGHDVVEQPLPDGSIRMTIRVGGGS